jgi:hypothetical protein
MNSVSIVCDGVVEEVLIYCRRIVRGLASDTRPAPAPRTNDLRMSGDRQRALRNSSQLEIKELGGADN